MTVNDYQEGVIGCILLTSGYSIQYKLHTCMHNMSLSEIQAFSKYPSARNNNNNWIIYKPNSH